ncbi:MAG TPA: hypothetical protein VLE22_08000, partial [Bryobacteraceae bacterium]|nr:hypothetical protein [Bryobacteraceae bacterium]
MPKIVVDRGQRFQVWRRPSFSVACEGGRRQKAIDFGEHAEQISHRVKEASLATMMAAGRPVQYLNSGKDDKQQLARSIAAADGISCGPICALTAVELCSSYAVRGNRSERKIELQRSYR